MIAFELEGPGSFEQDVRAVYVCLNKRIGREQRTIDVRLGREIDDGVDRVIPYGRCNRFGITDIALNETVTRLELCGDLQAVAKSALMCHFVENVHGQMGMVLKNTRDLLGADEACPACDQ